MQKKSFQEQRKYIRLNSIFPVELYLKEPGKTKARLVQGFTRDVSFGGICLTVNDPDDSLVALIEDTKTVLDVHINMPVTHHPIEVTARVAWHDMTQARHHKRLLIGLSYENISAKDKNRIMNAARRIKWLPRFAMTLIIALICLLGFSHYNNMVLVVKNQAIIDRFQKVSELSDVYKKSVVKIDKKYESARQELTQKEKQIGEISQNISQISPEDKELLVAEKSALEEKLKRALFEKENLEKRLKDISKRKGRASGLLDELLKRRSLLEEATVKNMYSWLKTHQNKITGLIMSFEGDSAIKNWGFTYDQSLASQVFLISGDYDRAKKILSFFKKKARKENGGYFNAYNVMSGNPTEYVVNIGPNIWIGIAAVQYTEITGDKTYLSMAEKIAKWAIKLKDKEGGLTGGPKFSWYSTEHNLDAYALFNLLYEVTGNTKYKKAAENTLKWIKENTYSMKTQSMKRGKGDSTIATDTMSWAIASIGPRKLLEVDMDPDAIAKFAEEQCAVNTTFIRPNSDRVRITGFDFGKAQNAARGGVVSSEWTAQMIMAFKIMSDFYKEVGDREKSKYYENKARFYLDELDKMVISSPSRSGQGAGCLPYATQPNANTGHGWRTPSGGDTGSVAGTAYTIFAKKGYNPLSRNR